MTRYEIERERRIGDPDLLYMKLVGNIDIDEAEEVLDELEDAVDAIGDEFYLINDISEFKPSAQEVKKAIARGKAMIEEAGVDAVVRVTGDSVIGKMQFESAGGEYDYQEANAESVEEAREMLADL